MGSLPARQFSCSNNKPIRQPRRAPSLNGGEEYLLSYVPEIPSLLSYHDVMEKPSG